MLETGSQQAEGLETLGRYAKLAQEYLLEGGKPVQPVAADGQTAGAAETDRGGSVGLHDQIVEDYVRIKAVERNINPADTMEMTRLRNEAAMIAQETVMQEVICKPR